MIIVQHGIPSASVVIGRQSTPIEAKAAQMLISEVRERCGATLPLVFDSDAAAGSSSLIILGTPASNTLLSSLDIQPEADPQGESIAVQSGTSGGRSAFFVVGAGQRGVVNAAVEVLNNLQYSGEDAALPDLAVRHRPSVAWRGSMHAHGSLYDPDKSAIFEHFRSFVAYMARRRGNTLHLWAGWPTSHSALVGYRHFPELLDEAQEPLLERKRQRARDCLALAGEYGIGVYLSTPELYYPARLPAIHPEIIAVDPPTVARQYKFDEWTRLERKPHICFSHPVTQGWYRAKVRELFEHLPQAAGLELWVSWADTDVFYCACPRCAKLTPAQHIQSLVDTALEAMDLATPGMNKRLLLRTYLGGWRQIFEEEFFGPLAGHKPERLTIGNKAQAGDMYYTHPPHPLTGKLAPATPEAVEFCLGGEYRGGNGWGMPAPISQYLSDRMRLYASQGVTWFVERNRLWRNRLNAADFEVFYALAWDLAASPEAIWQDWARRSFGAEAGPVVEEILKDATRVVEKAFYVQDVSFTSHHLLGENLERVRHLVFDRSAKSVDGGLVRLEPTPGNIRRILAEKDEAIFLSEDILRRVAALQGRLPEEDFQALSLSLHLQHEMTLIYRQLAEVFWRYLRWEHTLSEVDREFQRQDLTTALERFRTTVESARRVVPEYYNAQLFGSLGTEPAIWAAIDRSLGSEPVVTADLKLEQTFPFGYLDRIGSDIEKRINVEPGSLWGYYPRPAGDRATS